MPGTRGVRPGKAPAAVGAARGRTRKPVKARRAEADNARGTRSSDFELADLRRLIQLVQETGIGELEVTTGGRTVRIAAHTGAVPVTSVNAGVPHSAPDAAAPAASSAGGSAGTGNQKAITSPMVGTFYRSPAPDAEPYVEVGDMVDVGQTVCIVEAMKLMNEIESEVKGRVTRILVENAQPVEYGQKLFLIEP
jgi:acetyl-CoA carboxylase biotin carboxyl carrier protein